MDFFEKLADKIKSRWSGVVSSLKAYFRRLLFPLYLFPIKLATYSGYYAVKYLVKLIFSLLIITLETLVYPFRGLRNFLKSLFIGFLLVYVFFSLMVMADYIRTNYGMYAKFFCEPGLNARLKRSVVRVVGGFSEGSGFFIAEDRILTNFHVITGEPSPKIIFPDGSFTTASSITGDQGADLAIITIEQKHPDKILDLMQPVVLADEEPIIAAGYPLGTTVPGQVTITGGRFVALRRTRKSPVEYVHTTVNLAEGMSGGPLVDKCGRVVGVNTAGVSGNSFFISADSVNKLKESFTDKDVSHIKLDPSESPQEAVKAFYTYLKVRDMKTGFGLLSSKYLEKTNFEEWTGRFNDIIDVNVLKTEKVTESKDTAFAKFSTKNWVEGEVEMHYYEGTWMTVFEDGKFKLLKSNIKEVSNPEFSWFWE